MKILIYGAGAIGSIFAGKLSVNNEVTVLARGKRLHEIKKKGIILSDSKTNKKEHYNVQLIEKLLPDMKFDYIIVAMRNAQVKEVLPILAQNCTKNIVIMSNTAAGYEQWTKYIGEDRLMIGFPSGGGGNENGEISYFIARGFARVFQTTTIGEYSGKKTKRAESLIEAFCSAGIPTVFCPNMDEWQKTHVAIILSIAESLYGHHCNNYEIASSYESVKETVQAMKEGIKVIESNGMKVTPGKLAWLKLPLPILTIGFKLYMNTKIAETGMAKHCLIAKDENMALQKEFDEFIRKSGLKTPTLDKLRKNFSKVS